MTISRSIHEANVDLTSKWVNSERFWKWSRPHDYQWRRVCSRFKNSWSNFRDMCFCQLCQEWDCYSWNSLCRGDEERSVWSHALPHALARSSINACFSKWRKEWRCDYSVWTLRNWKDYSFSRSQTIIVGRWRALLDWPWSFQHWRRMLCKSN